MSGGVDSSFAAYLLKEQGYQVTGVTMAIFGGQDALGRARGHACYGPSEDEEIEAARQICRLLDLPHYTFDLRAEYQELVLGYFTEQYSKGRTPNPCARCNPLLKFGLLIQKAREQGLAFERFATGHYARVVYDAEQKRCLLKRGADPKKDQSYFLYGLKPELLSEIIFPVGGLTKLEVREGAERAGLPVWRRRESQDFIEGGDYLRLFSPEQLQPGPIVDTSGKQLGTHAGIVHYTIGQRRGLGVSAGEPLFVLRIDSEHNTLVVGPKAALLSRGLVAGEVNYLGMDPPYGPLRVAAQIRHNHRAAPCELIPLEREKARLVFDLPQLSVTPGQAAVFYRDDMVLGGGIIERAEPLDADTAAG
jgi:tRNA-specific 2-thiouridylase